MTEPAAIVLAAGASTRYRAAGGPELSKLIAEFRGEPVVRATARAALAVVARVIVVTGHAREAVEAALAGLPLIFAHNADYATGLASSLRAGIAALPADAPGAMVLLGDMPAVAPALLARILEAFAARPDALAVVPVTQGRRGNPALISRTLFSELAALQGDEGARRLLGEVDATRIVELLVVDAAVALDIDTPDDLLRVKGV